VVEYSENLAEGKTRFTLTVEETIYIQGFPRLGYYALECLNGKVTSGQWLSNIQIDLNEQHPRCDCTGADLLIAWFDGTNFTFERQLEPHSARFPLNRQSEAR
jgi:hypothetical protein